MQYRVCKFDLQHILDHTEVDLFQLLPASSFAQGVLEELE